MTDLIDAVMVRVCVGAHCCTCGNVGGQFAPPLSLFQVLPPYLLPSRFAMSYDPILCSISDAQNAGGLVSTQLHFAFNLFYIRLRCRNV